MIDLSITTPEKDYELLDSGDGEKLERFGSYVVSRPDPQALWRKRLPESEWKKAHGIFAREAEARWKFAKDVPEKWEIEFGGIKIWIRPTSFKHVGLFPEQRENWKWVSDVIKNAGKKVSVLNLFGYTGGATLAAAKAGAEVCHVDSSKSSVIWARQNALASGLQDAPIRWIVDDALAFVKREIKRGRKYDAIIMDPPAFGHGPKGELWKIEEDFLKLLDACKEVLSDTPVFFLINGYAAGYSPLAYKNSLLYIVEHNKGTLEQGELALQESGPDARLLPAGIFARWKFQ